MSARKRGFFIFMTFLTGAAGFYFSAASILISADRILAIVKDRPFGMQYFVFLGEIFFQGCSFMIIYSLAAVSIITAVIALMFYRKELSIKTLRLLYAQPLAVLIWGVLFFLNFAFHLPNAVGLMLTILSLAVIAVYSILTVKSMYNEIND